MNQQGQGNKLFSSALIRVALGVGCLTLMIIFASLLLGLWLDRTFDTLPLFTILLLVGSMPLSWVGVFKLVNRAKKQFQPTPSQPDRSTIPYREEAYRDED